MPTLQCAKCGLEVRVSEGAARVMRCKRCGATISAGAAERPAKAAAPRPRGEPASERARHFSGGEDSAAAVREALRPAGRSNSRVVFAAAALAFVAGAGGVALFELGRNSARDRAPDQSHIAAAAEARGFDERFRQEEQQHAKPVTGVPAVGESAFAKPLGDAEAPNAFAALPEAQADGKALATISANSTTAAGEGAAAGSAAAKGATAGGATLAAPAEAKAAATLQQVLADVERSVVTIRVTKDGGVSTGSGFIVDADGTIATNYHVIEGAKDVTIVFASSSEVAADGWRAVSPRRDLALIAAPAAATSAKPLALAATLPAKAEQVYAVGSPLGEFDGTIFGGIVSGLHKGSAVDAQLESGITVIQTTPPISTGNSGGPLLDSQARVVGVNTGSVKEGESLNFAIASQYVVKLLDGASRSALHWAQLPAPRPKSEELAQAAAKVPPQPPAEPAYDSAGKIIDGITSAQREDAEARSKQGKLDRIDARIRDLQRNLDKVEAEGRRLVDQLDAKKAEAEEVNAEGINARREFDRNGTSLLLRQQQLQANSDNNLPTFQLSLEISRIREERRRLNDTWQSLESNYARLDSEAASLIDRIETQRQLRGDVADQIEYLNLQGKIVSEGPTRFAARMFEIDVDVNQNGVITPREAPDEYHPVLHDADRNGDKVVSKEELEAFMEGFGDAPR